MLTLEKIKTEFSHINAFAGTSEVYHDTDVFEGHGKFCDLYFKSVDRQLSQKQVDTYNSFKKNQEKYFDEIERFINSSLISAEAKKMAQIKLQPLNIDVIEVPYDNPKYDLVLVCGKTFKNFLIFNKNINLRIELKDGRIMSIQRKKDTTEDNDSRE